MDLSTAVVRSQTKTHYNRPRRGKKCASNDNVKTRLLVERNAFSSLLDEKDAATIHTKRKAPLRPRPGQKKFMSSVLTILSKSTASTQHPDNNDAPIDKRPKPRRHNTLKSRENAKNLYTSRVLNQQTVNDDFVILQSRKDIHQSSSNYSESTNFGHADVERSREENSIFNQVLEGKKINKEEPRSAETGENDKKVYNLFVDLLETTINMYNNETDRDNSNGKNLNTILEINQDVAEKLEINNKYNESHHSFLRKKISDIATYRDGDSGTNIVHRTIPTFPKVKAKSFVQVKKAADLPRSKSFQPKSSTIKSKKKNLLKILKEQIQMGSAVEEPKNLYESLKIMAKNKQRTEKSVKLYQQAIENGRRDPECTFKRRNLFTKSKKKRKIDKVIQKHTYFDKARITSKKEAKKIKTVPSYNSVEVYGFNYEDNREFKEENELGRLREETEKRRVMFTYHPPSPLISDLDYCALLKYPDTSTSFCAIQQFGNYEIQ